MSYNSAPPPSGGVNPYGEVPEDAAATAPYGTPPPPPPPPGAQSWQTPTDAAQPGYGTPPPAPPGNPSYGTPPPGQGFGGPAARPPNYSPYTAASRYTGGPPGAPGYGGWIASSRDNGKGTGALVMGILSIVLCFGSVLGIGLGIGAIVMGVQGRKAAQGGTADNSGVATAGLILGSIGVGLSLLSSLSYLANAMA